MSSEPKVPADRELDDFLAGKHPAGRAYREASGSETAPRELDDAILRMAREHAAQSKAETGTPIRRRPRWLQPLAVAATLALSLGVLMNIWRDPSPREQVAPAEEGLPATTPPPPRGTESASAPAPTVQAERDGEPVASEARRAAPRPPPPPASESPRARPFPKEKARAAEPERDDALADRVSPSAVGPRAGGTMAPAAPPSPPPAPAASAPSGGPAPASRPDIDPRFSFGAAAPADEDAPVQEKKEIQAEAREQAQEALAAEAAAAQPQDSRQEPGTPEVLIERARAALARGDEEAARRVVAELRRRFPDAPLPEDLRPLASPTP